jgi:purine-binding chemotaxis protein CheW
MAEKESAQHIQNRFLTFMLDHEKYGVAILAVKEIIGYQKAIPVHKTPDYVKGILNLRGQIIPIIDLGLRFGIGEREHTMYSAIIITTIQDTNIGLIVDEVNEVTNVADENLSAPPEFGSTIDVSYLSKIAQDNKEVIMILDLDNVIDIHEMKKVNNTPSDGTDEV